MDAGSRGDGPAGVLVRMPNWLGDAVMATCVLRAVRAGAPGARIAAAARPKLGELFAGLPFMDEFVPLDDQSLAGALRLGWSRRGAFDLALILPNSLRSALMPFAARARRRIGYRGQGRGFLLTARLAPPGAGRGRRTPEPMPWYWRRIVEAAGLPWQGGAPELRVTDAEREGAAARARAFGLGADERLIGISPGAAFGPSKLWLPERFAEAAALLHRATGMRAIVFLAPGEEALGAEIARSARSPIISTANDLLSIGLLKAFMTRCALLLSTDSGTRHIAVALGTPVVTVVGPTDPRYTAYCLERQRVIAKKVPCGPCHFRECPTDHRCMTEIEAGEVAAAGLELLGRYAEAGRPNCAPGAPRAPTKKW